MMYLHDDIMLYKSLVERTSSAIGIRSDYVHKDYFVCMALKEIVTVNPDFVFKGGTALSKCYGIIKRFSEDVDLGLDCEKPTEGMRKRTKQAVKDAMRKLGLIIDNLDQTRSRRDFNQYCISLPLLSDISQQDILLIETALMTSSSPIQSGSVMSFIGEYLANEGRRDLLEKYALEHFAVNVVTLERTFADKSFAIADYYLNGEIPYRQSRHIYDLYQLRSEIKLDETFAALMSHVRKERENNHKCVSASLNVSLSGALQEIYSKQVYRVDYDKVTLPLLYDGLKYDTAISVLPEIISFLDEYPLV